MEPSLNLTYKVNSSHNINASAALNYMTPSIETLYSGYILTSYRQLSAYDVAGLYEGMNQNYSLKYDFKNILSMSFAGAEVAWYRQSPDVLYGSYYDGIVEHTISRRTSENSDMLSAKVHASQGFDWRRLKSVPRSHTPIMTALCLFRMQWCATRGIVWESTPT